MTYGPYTTCGHDIIRLEPVCFCKGLVYRGRPAGINMDCMLLTAGQREGVRERESKSESESEREREREREREK